MPQEDKSKYTDKQKRWAEHIEEGSKKKGLSTNGSESCAWATVNKHDDGGKRAVEDGVGPGRAAHEDRGGERLADRRQIAWNIAGISHHGLLANESATAAD